MKLAFNRSNYDICLYYKEGEGKDSLYLVLYVDDMLLANTNKSEIDDIKFKLKAEFDMKNLEPAKKILSIEIIRNKENGSLFLIQQSYVNKILKKSIYLIVNLYHYLLLIILN